MPPENEIKICPLSVVPTTVGMQIGVLLSNNGSLVMEIIFVPLYAVIALSVYKQFSYLCHFYTIGNFNYPSEKRYENRYRLLPDLWR